MGKRADYNDGIWLLDNPVMDYSWGSTTAIAELLGRPADSGKPQAEMWIGAHPKASSRIRGTDPPLSLAELIRQHPEAVLGPAVARAFGRQLPFLLKVLAADQPLSIQVHPQAAQARSGYAAENKLGLDPDDPRRNYRDPNPKPECICALTPFWGLCGFRPLDQMTALLQTACPDLAGRLASFGHLAPAEAIRCFCGELLAMAPGRQERIIDAALAWEEQIPERRWMAVLAAHYPGDIGIVFPLLLNLFCLQPGQALYLPPGTIHAYLKGVGVEVMASSDNVIRAGLTAKHKDIPELLDVVDFRPGDLTLLAPRKVCETRAVYETPAPQFKLGLITVGADRDHVRTACHGCEILLCTEGRAWINAAGHGPVPLTRGDAALIGAASDAYVVSGRATVYHVEIPALPVPPV